MTRDKHNAPTTSATRQIIKQNALVVGAMAFPTVGILIYQGVYLLHQSLQPYELLG